MSSVLVERTGFIARVTVPEGHTVASGGRLVARTAQDGKVTFVYENDKPIAIDAVVLSPVYETEPMGGPDDQGSFRIVRVSPGTYTLRVDRQVVALGRNLGFAGGMNRAIERIMRWNFARFMGAPLVSQSVCTAGFRSS